MKKVADVGVAGSAAILVLLGVLVGSVVRSFVTSEYRDTDTVPVSSVFDTSTTEQDSTAVSEPDHGGIVEYMKLEQLQIASGQTKTVGDLSITNKGGGHEILLDGDIIFTDIILAREGGTQETVRATYPQPEGAEPQVIVFGAYTIHIDSIEWNGESIGVTVTREQP